jgi:hypothetical protein
MQDFGRETRRKERPLGRPGDGRRIILKRVLEK